MTGPRLWTRRDALKGLAAAGIAGAALLVIGIERALNPPSNGTPSSGPLPSPASAASRASTAPGSPGASASPGPRQAYRTRPKATPPVVSVSHGPAADSAEGLIFLTPANGAGADGPLIVDDQGEPVWIRAGGGSAVTNFRVIQYRGKPALTWWEGANNNGIGSGQFVIADESYRVVKRLTGASGAKADLHEFLLTPTGTAIFFVDNPISIDRATGAPLAGPVMDCIVQEIHLETGRLVFEWHSTDHVDLAESFAEAPKTGDAIYDYFHGNSIDLDGERHLLVSARNTSAVYKVDRASGTVVWRLGGKRSDFTFGDGAAFGWQHDVRRRPDGTLTIFDNASGTIGAQSGPPSRAIVLSIDETAKAATLVREYLHPTTLTATSQGDVQVLANGDVFVGWGSTPWFTQFTSDGQVVLDGTFPASKQSYRDLRFTWSGSPKEPPDLVVEALGSGSLAVYASWNGHTGVAGWDVLVGPSESELARVGGAPRAGFETRIVVDTTEAFVAVRGLDASGAVLGQSQALARPA